MEERRLTLEQTGVHNKEKSRLRFNRILGDSESNLFPEEILKESREPGS